MTPFCSPKTRLFSALLTFLIPLSAFALPEFAFYGQTNNGYVRIFSGDANPNQEEQTIGPADILTSENLRRKNFQIRNTGDQTLLVFYPQISAMAENGFFIRDWPVGPGSLVEVNPGSFFTFKIGLNPQIQTAISILTIKHNGHGTGSTDFVAIIKGEANSGEADILYSPPGGNEVSIPNGDGTPTPVEGTNFGVLDVGRIANGDPYSFDPSVTHRFALRNRSAVGDTLTSLAPKIVDHEGNSSPHFSITNYSTSYSSPLNPGGLDLFDITFNPQSAGIHIATFTVETNDLDDHPYTFTVIGRGVTDGQLVVKGRLNETSAYQEIADGTTVPNALYGTILPATPVGGSSTHRFNLLSVGSEALEFTGQPTSSNPAFTIDPLAVMSMDADPNRPLAMYVNFEPTGRGLQFSDITIPSSDPDNPNFTFTVLANGIGPELVIKGTGDDAVVRDIPNDSNTAPNPDYGTLIGNVDSGAPDVTRDFILRNRGTQNAVISNLTLTGPHAGDFQLSGLNANGVNTEDIEPSSEKTLTLTFSPTTTGLRTATVVVEQLINAEPSTYEFQVSANVISTTEPTIIVLGTSSKTSPLKDIAPNSARPATANGTLFPDTIVRESSTSLFQIVNSGNATLRITRVIIEGEGSRDFAIKSNPTGNLAPESSASFSIDFAPISAAFSTATVVISSNDPDNPTFRFTIAGRGIEEQSGLPQTRIQSLSLSGQNATLTYAAETGKRFIITTSSSLRDGSWTRLTGTPIIDGGSGVQTLVIDDFITPGGPTRRFIRFEELE